MISDIPEPGATSKELPRCPHCGRAKPKDKWLPLPPCFNLKPGWKFVEVVCPNCQQLRN